MSKLEEMMKKEGWILGYSENWHVKYWSFRKDGFEVDLNDINKFDILDEDFPHFKKWRAEKHNNG